MPPVPPARPARRYAWLPAIAGALAALAGAVNVVSTLTPAMAARAELLHRVVPHEVTRSAHALALPLSVWLLVLAPYLAKRRRGAWAFAVAMLGGLTVLNLVKGLDYEEALLSAAAAGVLIRARDAFYVRHGRSAWREVPLAVALVAGAGLLTSLAAVVAASHYATPALTPGRALAEAIGALLNAHGPLTFREPVDWLPDRLGWLGVGTLAAIAYIVFRPLRGSAPPDASARPLVHRLVAAHGADTLDFFKLRGDLHYIFDPTRRACAAYAIHDGVMVLSGDPVGPEDAVPALMREIAAFAAVRGLRLGVVGASEAFARRGAEAGLRALYIGDEAIVDPAAFSLEGRAVRKIRQAVTRAERNGFTAEIARYGDLDEAALAEIDEVSERWRGGQPERGFSMALDGMRGDHLADTLVMTSRDADGRIRAFLHFVPSAGRPAVSLSAMRRDPGTPNGVTEMLLVRAFGALAERGVAEVSLNFAAFARYLHSPENALQQILARILRLGDRLFQIESLYRFNKKFDPRWQPRYLLFERPLDLPRTSVAALRAEGQLPSLRRVSQRPGA